MSTPAAAAASHVTAGSRLRQALKENKPLQLLGAVNAYSAMLAEHAGAKALYLSGSGVATASYGLPDLGITDLHDVLEDIRRITRATKLPLVVDIDTGFGGAFNIIRTIREIELAGAAGVHIEDQIAQKRCGHRPQKQIVPCDEMVDRIKSAVKGRADPSFLIMARTDALAREGLESAIARSKAYIAAGADALFPEAFTTLEQYQTYCKAFPGVPVLANITEFGQTPLFSKEELGNVGVSIVLYPLSAFRSMSKAAFDTYSLIIKDGHQKNAIPLMQTRAELYEHLNYHEYEDTLDKMFAVKKSDEEEEKGQKK